MGFQEPDYSILPEAVMDDADTRPSSRPTSRQVTLVLEEIDVQSPSSSSAKLSPDVTGQPPRNSSSSSPSSVVGVVVPLALPLPLLLPQENNLIDEPAIRLGSFHALFTSGQISAELDNAKTDDVSLLHHHESKFSVAENDVTTTATTKLKTNDNERGGGGVLVNNRNDTTNAISMLGLQTAATTT
jgi:hypothetical protein